MKDINLQQNIPTISRLVQENKMQFKEFDGVSSMTLFPVTPDGSSRVFFRVRIKDKPVCVGVAPADREEFSIKESESSYKIGSHLKSKGVPVPTIFAYDNESGIVLFEDLGDTRLHDVILENSTGAVLSSQMVSMYKKVLQNLVLVQCKGVEGFDSSWCCDTPEYDQNLMITRESQYFESSFWNGLLGQKSSEGLLDEFKDIASNAGSGQNNFFLYRDFQSRNIMIKGGNSYFIDFQGGRLGPLGYDLASLLHDPYAAISEEQQSELFDYYVSLLDSYRNVKLSTFMATYPFLALQRQLQIVGAYSFLTVTRKKEFFRQYIKPALQALGKRIEEHQFNAYPILRGMIKDGIKLYRD